MLFTRRLATGPLQVTVYAPTAAILFRLLQPFDQADERQANETTHLQVVNVPIEVALIPVNATLQNDIEVVVSIVGGTATGKCH